jgi:ribosomal protein S18 acetylase RimI-like enzyme
MKEEAAGGARRPGGVTLRRVTAGDEEFVYQVYASTRAEELAPLKWSAEQQDSFLRMQFTLRQRDYGARFDAAGHQIVLRGDRPVGIIWVSRDGREIRLADLALLPAQRGSGIGTILVRELIKESDRTGKPVRLMVLQVNRGALRLYERLGFKVVGTSGFYFEMERRPALGFGG